MHKNARANLLRQRANVLIVGAGPAGLGMARVLRDLAIPDIYVLERKQIGASFRAWPKGMRLITPSFPGNAFGLTDLNAISFDSSPGFSLKREHPSGAEYASYLDQAAMVFNLPVVTGVDVRAIEPNGDDVLLYTNQGEMCARFVIWATGQFQYPDDGEVVGAEHGVHSSLVQRWADHEGGEVMVIGGYESGIDAAIGLANAGKAVTVLSREPSWSSNEKYPSISLSPYTRQRLDVALRRKQITLVHEADILGLERDNGSVRAMAADGRSWSSTSRPILATGFIGGTSLIEDWIEFDDHGHPVLSAQDESTELPGLFLVGPEVRHSGQLFCFIYKFRQRFAVVARTIAGRLGADTSALEAYRSNNMFLDDLSCCEVDNCVC